MQKQVLNANNLKEMFWRLGHNVESGRIAPQQAAIAVKAGVAITGVVRAQILAAQLVSKGVEISGYSSDTPKPQITSRATKRKGRGRPRTRA